MPGNLVRLEEDALLRLRQYLLDKYGMTYGHIGPTIGKALKEYLDRETEAKGEEPRGSKPTPSSSNH